MSTRMRPGTPSSPRNLPAPCVRRAFRATDPHLPNTSDHQAAKAYAARQEYAQDDGGAHASGCDTDHAAGYVEMIAAVAILANQKRCGQNKKPRIQNPAHDNAKQQQIEKRSRTAQEIPVVKQFVPDCWMMPNCLVPGQGAERLRQPREQRVRVDVMVDHARLAEFPRVPGIAH